MTSPKFDKVIAIATTVCLILLGIAFIGCTAHLYFTGGDTPYTRERVGQYLLILALPSAITAGLAVSGLVSSLIKGGGEDETAPRTHSDLLASYLSRYDLSEIDGEAKTTLGKERKYRATYNAIAYSLSAAIFVVVLIYIGFFADFTIENLNGDVVSALAFALPMCAIAIGLHVPRLYLVEDSCRRELEAVKALVREFHPKRAEGSIAPAGKIRPAEVTRYVILAAAVCLIVLGIFNGGMKDVLSKAVKICTECIGLG